MCGISGFFNFKKPNLQLDKKLFNFAEQAAYVGAMRGRDGTGIFQVDRDRPDQTYVYKRAIDGACFADTMNFQGAIYSLDQSLATVIHNRKGTIGGNTDDMCHPHRVGDITLVHNGTLTSHRSLGGGNNFQSDSAAIAHALNVETQDAKNVLESLRGAYTLIWYDASLRTLNIARNEERPLSMAYVKNEDVMIFASEAGMLEWLTDRCKIEIGDVVSPKVGVHYYWNVVGQECGVHKYGKNVFTPDTPWDGYYGYGTGRQGRTWNSAQGRWNDPNPVGPANVVTAQSITSPTTQREERELSIKDNFGIKIGDRIKFVVYDTGSPSNYSGMCKIRGIDVNSMWEAQAYISWNCENQLKLGDLQGALVEGSVHTVVNTDTYDDWPIIDCANIVKISDKFWEEGYDYKREGKEIVVAEGTKPGLPWERPSPYCDCDEDDAADRCTEKCSECRKAEQIQVFADEINNRVDTQYPIGRNVYGSWADYLAVVKYGCSECCCDLTDPAETYYTYNDDPLCTDCVESYYNETQERAKH